MNKKEKNMITTAIFDMDGLLIDSEPLWRKAEIELFGSLDVPINEQRCRETMGLRTDEVVRYWYTRYPWEEISEEEVTQKLDAAVIDLVKEYGEGLPGVHYILDLTTKTFEHVALASSSKMRLIETVIDKLGIRQYFEILHSAEHEPFGKPHPGVYISTAKKLGVDPTQCLAFEDSFNGLLSAKAAKMKCVAIPEQLLRDDKRFGIADMICDSLEQCDEDALKKLQK